MLRSRRALWLLLGLSIMVSPLWAQPLPAPENLSVTYDGSVFRGRWSAVPEASYYEVWVRLYGNWKFSEKDHNASPFTSSFEIPGSDDRAVFKVRAVTAGGEKGRFSDETQASREEVSTGPTRPVGVTGGHDGFDPNAPAPQAPTSLFAIWGDPREIRLVWQATEGAVRYTVEELKDGAWVSVTNVEYLKSTTAVLKGKPMPGPYQFRVRAIGRNGRASEPSRPTTAKR